ncbi:MAG: DUF5681 domain-containing protein [Thermodesulfobacteriota bacterium]
MPETDKTAGKQRVRGRPWKPGQSGNPNGCPTGSRHKATLAVLALLDGEAEALTRKCVERALEGDSVALRLCLERLAPPRKDSPVILAGLPKIERAADLPKATGKIIEAVGKGDITPSEGQALAGLVEGHRKALEIADIEARLSALEAKEDRR